MDIEQVARVVKLVESSQLYKVTIENNGQSVTVVNNVNQHEIASPVKSKTIQNGADRNSVDIDSALSQVRATHVGQVYLSKDRKSVV